MKWLYVAIDTEGGIHYIEANNWWEACEEIHKWAYMDNIISISRIPTEDLYDIAIREEDGS